MPREGRKHEVVLVVSLRQGRLAVTHGARMLVLVLGLAGVLLAILGVESLGAARAELVCGVGTHRVVVRTPAFGYLPDECRPGSP